jgi:putative hydrolase of HD superfamily
VEASSGAVGPADPHRDGIEGAVDAVPERVQRFEQQVRFIVEIDKLKRVLRRTLLTDGSRRENSAEHSWHIALMAPLLAEHGGASVDVSRVIRMLLVHDVVEVDAGDTFAYDAAGNVDRLEREQRAADRIFGLLPADQAAELRALWDEFEAAATDDARFAHAVDRLQPLLQNLHNEGGTWRSHGVTREQVVGRMRPIEDATPDLWSFVIRSIDEVWSRGRVLHWDEHGRGEGEASETPIDRAP